MGLLIIIPFALIVHLYQNSTLYALCTKCSPQPQSRHITIFWSISYMRLALFSFHGNFKIKFFTIQYLNFAIDTCFCVHFYKGTKSLPFFLLLCIHRTFVRRIVAVKKTHSAYCHRDVLGFAFLGDPTWLWLCFVCGSKAGFGADLKGANFTWGENGWSFVPVPVS